MTCSVTNCNKPVKARGLCNTHYAQAVRARVLDAYPRKRPKPEGFCAWDGCPEPARIKGFCRHHYESDRWRAEHPVPRAPAPPKEVRLSREERLHGTQPTGRDKPMLGRGSPSPLPSPPREAVIPEGFLTGSIRVGSVDAQRTTHGWTIHSDPNCGWVDPIFCEYVDIWEHPDVGRYVVDKRSLGRLPVKECSQCERRNRTHCPRGHELSGGRLCKTCKAASDMKRRARKAASDSPSEDA